MSFSGRVVNAPAEGEAPTPGQQKLQELLQLIQLQQYVVLFSLEQAVEAEAVDDTGMEVESAGDAAAASDQPAPEATEQLAQQRAREERAAKRHKRKAL